MAQFTCDVCGNQFTSRRAAEYCSPKCKRRREYKRQQWDLQAQMYQQHGMAAELAALGPRP